MPYSYQIRKAESTYFLTLTAVEGADAFMRREHKQLLCHNLNYFKDKKGLELLAYVFMLSHMHMIARAHNNNLSDVIRNFKNLRARR